MFSRISARGRPAVLRQYVLGLLAIVWLNMAILPCAMAFQGDEDCPHCPPAEDQEMASHHEHGEASAETSCATSQPDCCDAMAASVDVRGSKLEFKPASDVVLITAPVPTRLPTSVLGHRHGALDPPRIVGSSPPLHVLFCVYLD